MTKIIWEDAMYIGLDIGTSGVKALLVDADQAPLAEAKAHLRAASEAIN